MTFPGSISVSRSRPAVRRRRFGAVGAALAIGALTCPTASAAAPTSANSGTALGGWTLSASAAPVTLEFYDPKIPIPASPGKPNLEFDVSYSRSSFGSGPSGAATASFLWPGDAVGLGLGQLFNSPNVKYPVVTNVQYPGSTPDATLQPVPGSYMQAHADGNGSTATSTFGLPLPGTGPGTSPAPSATASPPAGLLGGLLGGGGSGGLPDLTSLTGFLLGSSALVDVEGERSQCSTTVAGDQAVASAESDAGKLLILGGLIEFDSLKVTAKSTSDGSKGTSSGEVDYGSMSVAGIPFGITSNGVKTPLGTVALPQLPAPMNQLLAPLGISITMPDAGDLSRDAQGQMFSHGLQITIDTAVLKKVSPLTPVLNQLVAQIPPSLTSQLPPTLTQVLSSLPALAPKIVLTIGSAKSQAVASPAVDLSGGTTAGATGGTTSGDSSAGLSGSGGSSAGTSGGGSGGYGGSGGTAGGSGTLGSAGGANGAVGGSQGADGGTARVGPVANALQPAAFGGLPGQLLVAGLALACLVAWGLRKYSSLLFGGAGCEDGHSSGVPELRDFEGGPE